MKQPSVGQLLGALPQELSDEPLRGATTEQYRHQRIASNLILDMNGALVAHDLGVGKRKTAIDALCAIRVSTSLVLCPKLVLLAALWPREVRRHKWLDLRVINPMMPRTLDERIEMIYRNVKSGHRLRVMVVVDYESALDTTMTNILLERTWDAVILDQSHQITFSEDLAALAHDLGRLADYRIALTANPMPCGNPEALSAQMKFVQPHSWPTLDAFRARYGQSISCGPEATVWQYDHSLRDLRHKLAPFVHRARRDEELDWPRVTHLSYSVPGQGGNAAVLDYTLQTLPVSEPVVVYHYGDPPLSGRMNATGRVRWAHDGGENDQMGMWLSRSGGDVLVCDMACTDTQDLWRAMVAVFFDRPRTDADRERAINRLIGPKGPRPVVFIHAYAEET